MKLETAVRQIRELCREEQRDFANIEGEELERLSLQDYSIFQGREEFSCVIGEILGRVKE
jgi:hypothetical protein